MTSLLVGDLNDAIAVVTGYDVIWGERLSMEERGLYAAAMLLPGVGGRMLTKADDVASFATTGKHTINWGQQGKHIPRHKNYIEGRSILVADPQRLLDQYAGSGVCIHQRERVVTDEAIGYWVPRSGGQTAMTTNFTIHYRKDGTAHIVPWAP